MYQTPASRTGLALGTTRRLRLLREFSVGRNERVRYDHLPKVVSVEKWGNGEMGIQLNMVIVRMISDELWEYNARSLFIAAGSTRYFFYTMSLFITIF